VRNVELAPGFQSLDDRLQMSSKRKMRRRSQPAGQLLEIVYGPLSQPGHSQLSPEIRETLPELHALVRDDPRTAVTELRARIAREPLPLFFNWLSGAYSALGDERGVEDTVRENYRRNPQYLFARVNYAELCLRDGDLDGALEALGEGLDIRALLGGRKRMHVSELTAYFYAVGLYHIKAGDLAAAENIYGILKEAAPDEPPTKELRRKLHPRLRDLLFTRRRRP
jgi:tetratricopeptide (TPR) repeat protein